MTKIFFFSLSLSLPLPLPSHFHLLHEGKKFSFENKQKKKLASVDFPNYTVSHTQKKREREMKSFQMSPAKNWPLFRGHFSVPTPFPTGQPVAPFFSSDFPTSNALLIDFFPSSDAEILLLSTN